MSDPKAENLSEWIRRTMGGEKKPAKERLALARSAFKKRKKK